jgi:hypothetical protein
MFTLDTVVPWGRSFDEYCSMFDLSDRDLGLKILDCGGGPSSFNAEATSQARSIVSCDPIYRFDAAQIETRIAETYVEVLEQTRRNQEEFVWGHVRSVDELGVMRMAAMRRFLDDYPAGRLSGRYVIGELPMLPFAERSFGLALSSHLLFLYTEQFDEAFHRSSIVEMSRVADEVRVFPLLALGAVRSRHVDPIADEMRRRGFRVTIETVPYEFQKGGHRMMRIRRTGIDRGRAFTC